MYVSVSTNVTGTFPAKILAQQKTISENSNLYVTCSTFGVKRDTLVYVYLCKDGCGISRKELTQDKTDITFTISRVGLDHSGNYSCVYSIQEFYYSEVAGRGKNIIQILVIGKVHSYESFMSKLFPSTHFVLLQPILSLQIFQ